MLIARRATTTVEDLWDELTELSELLPLDDSAEHDYRVEREGRLTLLDDEHDEAGEDEDQISDSFVYTRFILRQTSRFQDYVAERLIGAARESWSLIQYHCAECPGIIPADLEQAISEALDELVSRSPIDLYDRFRHERWLPLLLNQVSQSIMARVGDDPLFLTRLTPRAFEDFVGKLFLTTGYEVELTKPTKDGGYDVVALKKERDGDHKLLIEVKRYARNRPVGVSLVRQLLGLHADDGPTRVVLATTSSFTKAARELQQRHKYRLELKDYDELMAWAKECSAKLKVPQIEEITAPQTSGSRRSAVRRDSVPRSK